MAKSKWFFKFSTCIVWASVAFFVVLLAQVRDGNREKEAHPNRSGPSRELQESLGPSGPEIQKKSGKKSPGASGRGVPKSLEKVSKKSRKSPEETFSRLFPDFSDFSRLFPDFLGLRPRETFFQSFFGFRARSARVSETPVARGRVRNPNRSGVWGGMQRSRNQ